LLLQAGAAVPFDPVSLANLTSFLSQDPFFLRDVIQLHGSPFSLTQRKLLTTQKREHLTLEEAFATQTPRRFLLACTAAFIVFLLLFVSLQVWAHSRESVPESLSTVFSKLFFKPVELLKAAPRYIALALALISLLLGIGRLVIKFPANSPDPLFARLLKQRAPASDRVSRFIIRDILADPRFTVILERALDVVFPISSEKLLSLYNLDTSDDEWKSFVQRLTEKLNQDDRFLRFFNNHTESAITDGQRNALYAHLDYALRQILFTEILDDPDFAQLFQDHQPIWRKIVAWASSIDLEKASKLFRPSESHHEKPSQTKSVLNAAAVIVVVLVAANLYCKRSSETDSGQTRVLFDDPQIDRISEALKAIAARIPESPTSGPAQPEQPIHVTVSPQSPPIIHLPATSLNLSLPPKLDLNLTSDTISKIALSGLPTIPLLQPQTPPPGTNPPPNQNDLGGDDLAVFTPQQLTSTLLLHTTSGTPCSYTVTLNHAERWPPDPVTLTLDSADQTNEAPDRAANKDGCPTLPATTPANSKVIPVGATPLYSELLHAYLSIDESSRKPFLAHVFPALGKDLLVIRVSYQAKPGA